jgi:hypothetical protein
MALLTILLSPLTLLTTVQPCTGGFGLIHSGVHAARLASFDQARDDKILKHISSSVDSISDTLAAFFKKRKRFGRIPPIGNE